MSTKSIKDYIRIPKITEENKYIKDKIIELSKKILDLEEMKLSDFVDFSKVMLQKFDKVNTKNGNLLLTENDEVISLRAKGKIKLIAENIKRLFDKTEKICLSDLRNLEIIDFLKYDKLKGYIDDLIFALYFKIDIEKEIIGNSKKIRKECVKNRFYKLVKN